MIGRGERVEHMRDCIYPCIPAVKEADAVSVALVMLREGCAGLMVEEQV